jgi:hypothetical protein
MTDYHSLFYYQIVSTLQDLKGGGGLLRDQHRPKKGSPVFDVCFEPRADYYQHMYMRDNFIASRCRVMIGRKNSDEPYDRAVIVIQENSNESVTMYKEAVKYIFGESWQDAMNELKQLLDKFYTVTVEERSEHGAVDFSTGRHPNQYYINGL